MKIVLLNDRIPPEGKGGAEVVVWRLAQGLKAAGHDVHVIATTAGPAFEESRAGLPTYHIQTGYPERWRAWFSLWNPQTVGALRALFVRLQPDVVNAHNVHFYLSYHALKLARAAGAGVVFSAHDAMPFAYGKLRHFAQPDLGAMQLPAAYRLPALYNLRQNRLRYNPARNLLIRRYLAGSAHIRTVPSRALAQAWAANNMPTVEVVHNGVDLAQWRPVAAAQVADLRAKLGLEGKRVMLFAGRLSADKGMWQALAALDKLRLAVPEARLLLLTARAIAEQLPPAFAHLRPWLCSGGWLSGAELRAAYQLADVVTVPSVYLDPFPTVNLEAMALARPVVATCFGGAAEVIADQETGFIVNPFDTDEFATCWQRLLQDAALARTMGQRGQARIRQHFSLERQVQKLLEIYERARQMQKRSYML